MPERDTTSSGGPDGLPTREERRPASAGRRSGASARPEPTERGRPARDRILRAATELFSTRGFSGTRVDDVLRASGTGKSQFYHYFGSKADLARAVLRYHRSATISGTSPVYGYLDDWDRIAAWFDDILRQATQEPSEAPLAYGFSSFAADAPPDVLREVARTSSLRRRLLLRGLRRLQRRGELRAEADPERIADFVAAAIEGGLLSARTAGSDAVLRNALGEAFAYLESFSADRPPDGGAVG